MAKLFVNPEAPLAADSKKSFQLDGWIDTAPFEDLIGIVLKHVGEGRATLECLATVKLTQGGGVVHGGVLTTLADTAVAMAIKSLLPEGTVFATTELQMKFLKPVQSGWVRAEAEVTEQAGRTFHGKADVLNDDREKVAEFISVFRVAHNQPHTVNQKADS